MKIMYGVSFFIAVASAFMLSCTQTSNRTEKESTTQAVKKDGSQDLLLYINNGKTDKDKVRYVILGCQPSSTDGLEALAEEVHNIKKEYTQSSDVNSMGASLRICKHINGSPRDYTMADIGVINGHFENGFIRAFFQHWMQQNNVRAIDKLDISDAAFKAYVIAGGGLSVFMALWSNQNVIVDLMLSVTPFLGWNGLKLLYYSAKNIKTLVVDGRHVENRISKEILPNVLKALGGETTNSTPQLQEHDETLTPENFELTRQALRRAVDKFQHPEKYTQQDN